MDLPSDIKFGSFFAILFLFAAFYFSYDSKFYLALFFFALAGVFIFLTVFRFEVLHSLNKAWFLLGIFLGRIVSPIIWGIIFFVLITPTSLFFRLKGRDELRLKTKSNTSYWRAHESHGTEISSFKKQF